MRWRAFLIVSLTVNVLFAVTLLVYRHRVNARHAAPADQSTSALSDHLQTNVIVRRQFFTWREVESTDYPTYIANLRDIGCPESTIRDIIVADVNQLYALKRATEVVTADQQWWRAQPDAAVAQAADAKVRALDAERRALLTRLLGPNWETPEPTPIVQAAAPPRARLTLDGPVLGLLMADAKRAVEEISARSMDRLQAYTEAQRKAGKAPDPVELARLRQQTRDQLAQVLNPNQLEEFLLRYSDSAARLRTQLGGLRFFDVTPDEFRGLFRATDALDQQIRIYYSGNDPASVAQRQSLESQRDEAIRLALGDKRYADYHRLQDSTYRDAVAAAAQAEAPGAAQTLYEISKASDAERDRIKLDPTLTPLQREIELKKLEVEQLKANTAATGGELPPEPPALPPTPPTRQAHVMRLGESVDTLAFYYGIPVSDIFRANRDVDFTKLKPGDTIQVPIR